MANKQLTGFVLSAFLIFSIFFTSTPLIGYAQAPATGAAVTSEIGYSKALATIEEKVEARRKELGIPGMSLAIVKDDAVIFSKGLGYKDFEKKVPVTSETQFAIGSSTKAFTGLTVLMTADEGKISLDSSPKTVLPYFKMQDPETDKNMTIRDLLTHSSGLNRTDLAMITGKLNRQELIRVAGEAKPIGKLRERFGYQNLMYAAAGEVVAVAQKQPWEKFVPERIFKPLGMANSNMSIAEMEKAKDRSFGYIYNFDTKETRKLPYRPIDDVAPAGSINSSANDMAKWLRFILSGGLAPDGKRLVSEKSFEEWIKPQMKMNPAGSAHYALGWMVMKWNDLTVVQHGGNIDGFNALVALIPEKKLGFVMLTNVSGSSLGTELMPIVWENILGKPQSGNAGTPAVTPDKEVGKYKFEAAGFDLDIQWKDGKLVAVVPNQPIYTLENVGGRRYRLTGAPNGFFVTFKDKELYLEQPHGNYTLPRIGIERPANSGAAKELVGKYRAVSAPLEIDIKENDGKVQLIVPNQQPYTLNETAKDNYHPAPLPEGFALKVKRDAAGKIESIVMVQPGSEIELKPIAASEKPPISVDELYQKAIAASGGEANWRKLTSRVTTSNLDLEHQGVKAVVTSWAKAPNLAANETTFKALAKEIGKGWDYFDGSGGEQSLSFYPSEKFAGKRLEDARIASDFYSMLDWTSKYKSITVKQIAKVGDEDAYAVEFEPENGTKFTEYYSTKTFLLLKREGVVPSSTSSQSLPYSILYSDYRDVDGVKLPFKTVNNSVSNGDVVTLVTSIKHNVAVDDKIFAPRKFQ
ncbi:MAG TPA: serine hydrolase domain-containing protein [Pyrinomonadaceae bacterium]|nr:serine hydrolase domain-containing protein [Pyrinomonadaceae bacterium]